MDIALDSSVVEEAAKQKRLPWFPVVMLHRITETTPEDNFYSLCISQDNLARIIHILRSSGYEIVTFEDAFAAWQRGESIQRKACLTFDDGYQDFYTHAVPVLERLECPASVYVVTDRLGGTNTWDAHQLPEVPLMTREQVKDVVAKGFEVGVHSATHPHLHQLLQRYREPEIAGAKRELENLLDKPADVYAYPYWDQNEDVRAEVEAAGFKAALGGEQPEHEPFLVYRCDFKSLNGLSIRLKIGGWHHRAVHNRPVRMMRWVAHVALRR
jgi:peptidoglycan/xylan/chitin deacetylase (PgdA/CDA1 family)